MFGFMTRKKTAENVGFKTRKPRHRKRIFAALRKNIIGHDAVIDGPFGARRLMYADYVASGRSYGPIEDTIRNSVLPLYANTHTESSATGRQSTAYREQARCIIGSQSLNASDDDAIVFCGAGCTGAIDKLIGILRLKLPQGMSRYGIDTKIKAAEPPGRFSSAHYEHHSNDVQWRETIADVVTIEPKQTDGLVVSWQTSKSSSRNTKKRPRENW